MASNFHPLADPGPHRHRRPAYSGGYNDQAIQYPSTPYHFHPDFNPAADSSDSSPSTTGRPFANKRFSRQRSITALLLPSDQVSSTTLIDSAEQHLVPGTPTQSATPPNILHSQMASQHHVYFSSPLQSPIIKNENSQHSSSEGHPERAFYAPNSPVHCDRASVEPAMPLNGANPNSPPVKKLEAYPAPLKARRKRLSNLRFTVLALLGCLLIGAAIGIICYVHQRHLKRTAPTSVSGDDGDVIAQSGLGSARNGTGDDDADPFGGGPPDEPIGSDNGQHYDSLIVFGKACFRQSKWDHKSHHYPNVYPQVLLTAIMHTPGQPYTRQVSSQNLTSKVCHPYLSPLSMPSA